MAKFKFYVSTGYVGSKTEEVIEIDDQELEGMTDKEIDEYVNKIYYQDWLDNNAEFGFYKVEEDSE